MKLLGKPKGKSASMSEIHTYTQDLKDMVELRDNGAQGKDREQYATIVSVMGEVLLRLHERL